MKLTKIVNIYPSMPITGINPPIRSTVKHVTKSIDEIRTCLMARAIVEEILSDGKTVRLNIGNYDKCLNEANGVACNCAGGCGCGSIKVDSDPTNTASVTNASESTWQIVYNNALAGKDLAAMTRKQRRAVEAAARAAADAAVAETEPEVVMGVGSIETVEDATETAPEEVAETTEEVETVEEEKVETIDVEAPVETETEADDVE